MYSERQDFEAGDVFEGMWCVFNEFARHFVLDGNPVHARTRPVNIEIAVLVAFEFDEVMGAVAQAIFGKANARIRQWFTVVEDAVSPA